MKATTTLTLSFLVAALGAGCESMNNTQRGAAAGAATGAVLGGVVGHQSGETTAGAAIGAAAGGIAGAAIGHRQDQRAEANAPTMADTGYVIQSPPPMPTSNPRETIPARPAANSVWVPGEYAYTGNPQNPYDWVPGHWDTPPVGTSQWVPGMWQRSGTGYIWSRGHWQ